MALKYNMADQRPRVAMRQKRCENSVDWDTVPLYRGGNVIIEEKYI